MVPVPKGALDCLTAPMSYIQCWWSLGVESVDSFRDLEAKGVIMYRGELPQYIDAVRTVVTNSDVLSGYDIDGALAALPPAATS